MAELTSIREQIVDVIITLLSASSEKAPLGVNVHRQRTRPLDQEKLPAIVLYFGEEDPIPLAHQSFAAPLTERQLALFVECRAAGDPNVPPDVTLDPLLVWCQQQILQNEKFNGLAMGVTEAKTIWQSQEEDFVAAAAVIMFIVRYRTLRTDPTAQNSGG